MMSSTPLFQYYEVVKVVSENSTLREINGMTGAILGMAQNDNGEWSYGVQILETNENWDIRESDLVATGKLMKRGDFYDDSSVKVVVDPETGEGNMSVD